MDRHLSFTDLRSKFVLNLVCHIQDGLSGDSIQDAAVIWGRQKLKVSIATLLEHENIEDSHLLDVIVKEPKHVVKAIHLGISDRGHQGPQVATHSILAMTKLPVLVNIVAALQADALLVEQDGVEHDQHLGLLRRPHS